VHFFTKFVSLSVRSGNNAHLMLWKSSYASCYDMNFSHALKSCSVLSSIETDSVFFFSRFFKNVLCYGSHRMSFTYCECQIFLCSMLETGKCSYKMVVWNFEGGGAHGYAGLTSSATEVHRTQYTVGLSDELFDKAASVVAATSSGASVAQPSSWRRPTSAHPTLDLRASLVAGASSPRGISRWLRSRSSGSPRQSLTLSGYNFEGNELKFS
jgi:hypothetical protein